MGLHNRQADRETPLKTGKSRMLNIWMGKWDIGNSGQETREERIRRNVVVKQRRNKERIKSLHIMTDHRLLASRVGKY